MSDNPVAALKAELFKSLAHPVRILALEQLVAGERSVGELAELIGVELAQVSQQLAVLRRAQVVTTRREGNTIFYSVLDERLADLLEVARSLLVSRLQSSTALLDTLEQEVSSHS